MEPNKFYITTTLPYVNSKPHMGHALEFVQADILARHHRLLGDEVFFNTGTDEHGIKIYRKAAEAGQDTQDYVDRFAQTFVDALGRLDIEYTKFIRTTDPAHQAAAQEFWKRCDAKGDIYKKNYQVKYCVGCELEKMESELDEAGRCLLHPNLEIETIEEENYFFRFSRYQQPLLDFYETHPDFVVPDFRYNEIKQFVRQGLQDFSISRVKDKMPWGIPVPGDDNQVMYVWFDALINYISTLGWPAPGQFEAFWGTVGNLKAVQVAGKDNLRQQSAMWQAMLMSADLPNSRQIFIHGFITSGGEKMSKSLGNVIDPLEVIDRYGTEALRYWFAREMSTFEDGDFTMERFLESYNTGLANGVGNLTSRILKMAASNGIEPDPKDLLQTYQPSPHLERYEIQKAIIEIWHAISELDSYIQRTEPFKTIKTDPEKAKFDIRYLLGGLYKIALSLQPFLPAASKKILESFKRIAEDNIPRLFPRL